MAGNLGLSLGRSLPVPNVQALVDAAGGDLPVIPGRYIRPEMEEEPIETAGGATEKIPVVDLGKLLGDARLSRAEEAAKLRSACEDWGFFQLVNHGVPEEVMGRMAAALEGFFAQTLEEKMASSKQPEGSVEGYGQAFVVSEEQKLDWADILHLFTQPPHLRNLALWPTHPSNFRATLEEYSVEMRRVALCLLGCMADNLGLHPEKLAGSFTEGSQSVRMNYYPPCRHHADRVLGLAPHSDGVGLTLLFQASTVPGLQIRRHGKWLAVEPLPGALVVNIGDILEVINICSVQM
ncbi:hypothetical protein Taro_024236 [Colocasia esculenta]|uniref:Fe2OG dioxygenase domain-containing protein n=1 Tax=Colocasia esculenta TaxID=4460 RepID=A0A843UZT2_COLES|nr:hypothetical protein [Colocasia esculenta]